MDVTRTMTAETHMHRGLWLRALRVYVPFVAAANLLWETAHLPLYTVWQDGTAAYLAFVVAHCTGGDLLIAFAALGLALLVAGDSAWPLRRFREVAVLTTGLGVAYTIFSEWLNLVIQKNWAYSDLMPVIPVIDVGLSPLLQWIVIPVSGMALAGRAALVRNT